MSWRVPIHALRAHLDAVCEAASDGEMIIIRRPGKEDVRLMSRSEWGGTSETAAAFGNPVNAVRLYAAMGFLDERPDGSFVLTDACNDLPKPIPPR